MNMEFLLGESKFDCPNEIEENVRYFLDFLFDSLIFTFEHWREKMYETILVKFSYILELFQSHDYEGLVGFIYVVRRSSI